MRKTFEVIKGIVFLLLTLLSIMIFMIVCIITFIPHLIYVYCAETLKDAYDYINLVDQDLEMREKNR